MLRFIIFMKQCLYNNHYRKFYYAAQLKLYIKRAAY